METLLRRLGLWTIICSISAAPSFFWASGALAGKSNFDPLAMVTGVCLFIAIYTIATSTPQFERFRNRMFMRRTLYIGYGIRLGMSILFPVGMAFDLFPGILSVNLVQTVLGRYWSSFSFVATLATTIVQGTILNFLMLILLLIIWTIQRIFCKPPEDLRRGFEVVRPVEEI